MVPDNVCSTSERQERSQILQKSGGSTERDYMAKIRYELLELMLGQAKEYLKRSEPISDVTAAIKLVNNGNKPNTQFQMQCCPTSHSSIGYY